MALFLFAENIIHNRFLTGLGAQVDGRVEQLLDERAERISLGEARNLVPELEVVEDDLHVRREAVEIRLEIGAQLLLARTGAKVAQGELRDVVEGVPRGLPERRVLLDDALLVEVGLQVEHCLLVRLQNRVQPPQDHHGENDIPILAADIEIAKNIVGDSPDEVGDPVELE